MIFKADPPDLQLLKNLLLTKSYKYGIICIESKREVFRLCLMILTKSEKDV